MSRIALAAAAVLFLAGWGSEEHIDICSRIDVPGPAAATEIRGYTVAEWCALPDYAVSIGNILSSGQCSGYRNWFVEWYDYAFAGPCVTVWMENNNHFGGFAYSSWHYYHQIAKQAAAKYASSCTPGCDEAALAIEGWSLHFLTDVFAAGHAWNPLGDYETPTGSYWLTHSSASGLPDPIFPPPGGINVYRKDLHDYLNAETVIGGPAIQFADARFGVGVVGDVQWAAGLAPAQQVAWTLNTANASMLDLYWTLIGVNGIGGCVLVNVCDPDYLQGYLDQGNAYLCTPWVSNQSFAQALTALGANSSTYTYYGTCSTANPSGHDCAWADPERGIPFWPGSMHYYIDSSSVIGALGCDLGDPVVYGGGNCVNTVYDADAWIAGVCDVLSPGACDFRDVCDVSAPGSRGPDAGPPGAADAGPSTSDGGAGGSGPDSGSTAGGGGGGGGCTIALRGRDCDALWWLLAAAALVRPTRRRRR